MRERSRDGLIIAVLLVLSGLFLSTPFIVRSLEGNEALIGQQSYHHLGLAQDGPLVEGATLFDVLASLFLFLPPLLAAKVLPVALGMAALAVFFFQSSRLLDHEERAAASLLVLISPLYLVLFTSLAPAGLVLLITSVSWWLYDRSPALSMTLLCTLIAVDGKGFILASLLFVAYGLIRGSWKPAAVGGGVGLFVIIFLYEAFGFLARESILLPASVSDFFVSLGADFGYSFFILFLALVGVLSSWSRKRSQVAASVIIIGVFLFSLGDTTARVLLLPVMALLAGKGALVLLRRSWTVKSIRNATLFLAGLSLLFTLVLTISGLVAEEPGAAKVEALRFLGTVPGEGAVLSSSGNGVFIERVSGRSAYLDDVVLEVDEAHRRALVAERIFMAQRVDEALELLSENGISHVLIDQEMRSGGVWTYEEQGLLFLLEHSERFVKLYDRGGVQVYRVVR